MYALNDAGVAIGRAFNGFNDRAVRWDAAGAITELGHLGLSSEGTTTVTSRTLNSAGTAVGYMFKHDASGNYQGTVPVRWEASGTAAIELESPVTLTGMQFGDARAINDNGVAVGYVQKPPGFPTDEFGTRAARWDGSGTAVTLLGTLGVAPNGEGLSDALAINSFGLIVGTSTRYNEAHGVSEFRAVYWRDAIAPVDLNALIDPASGWVLSHAYAVSDTGWIAGDGLFDPDGPGGQVAYGRHFLLQLPPQAEGDFNTDNAVDGADFLAWQRGESPDPLSPVDLAAWESHFGGPDSSATSRAVPEPTAHALCAMLLLGCTRLRRHWSLAQRILGIFTVSLVVLCGPRPAIAEHSVARIWNEQLLNAISIDTARPTVHARNLFHLSAAMYDAWAAYDDTAQQYLHHERATAADIEAARNEAVTYAALNIILHRFYEGPAGVGPGRNQTRAAVRQQMADLGYRPINLSTVGDTPAALGNRIAQTVINRVLSDGANEADNYFNPPGWEPVNEPLVFDLPGATMNDPSRWQPLHFLGGRIDQGGLPINEATQTHLTPFWGEVTPFAITSADRTPHGGRYVYHDQGAPRQLGGPADAQFKQRDALEFLRISSHLDPNDDEVIDISPASRGNTPNAPFTESYDQVGYAMNPMTGLPYEPQLVRHGDFGRVAAEFWADGPRSTAPPGHWNEIANDVTDKMEQLGLAKRVGGAGPVVDDLEWDVKKYFALNGALHDAAIAAWNHKGVYDSARPISFIRYMGQLGQSSDSNLIVDLGNGNLVNTYHPDGLPLEAGLVEVITPETTAPGQRHEHLAGHKGEIAVFAWQGAIDGVAPFQDPSQISGVDWILAKTWMPYQLISFVTPPFAGYVSGHSTFSRAGAEVLSLLTGSEFFPGGLFEYEIPGGSGLGFEYGPSEALKLQFATYFDASDQASMSRLYGGIHPPTDDFAGRRIGSLIGPAAYALASRYFAGVPEPSGALLLTVGAIGMLRGRRRFGIGKAPLIVHPACSLLAVQAIFAFGSTASAQFFTDDLSRATNWTIAQTSDSTFAFGYDYSQDSLPPAPNGSDTIGLKFEVNNNEPGGVEQIGAFYGSALLTGQYTFRVDVWSNWALDGGGSGIGTTEFTGLSVGHDGFDPGPYGASFLYTGDGDASSIPDYSLYKNGFRLSAEFGQYTLGTFEEDLDNSNPILTAAFPAFDIATAVPAQGQSGLQQAGAAGFQWMTVNVEVDVDAIGPSGADTDPGFSRFSMRSARSGNTVQIGTVDNSTQLEPPVAMDGVIGLLMSDLFPSVDVNAAFSFGIFDNVQVFEGLVPLEPDGLPGDFNGDGAVDSADLAQWQMGFGSTPGSDADVDGDSDGADFLIWQRQVGSAGGAVPGAAAVPEPATAGLLAMFASVLLVRQRRRRRRRRVIGWQRGESPDSLSAGDLAAWNAHFGGPGSSATSRAVPEPSIAALAIALSFALPGFMRREQRRQREARRDA